MTSATLVERSPQSSKCTAAIVTAASSAEEGLQAVPGRHSFDIVLCDIAMPEQDGYSLIRSIRSPADEKSRIPAVALTAYGRPAEREIALGEGFDEYLKKPVEPEELISLVASMARPRVIDGPRICRDSSAGPRQPTSGADDQRRTTAIGGRYEGRDHDELIASPSDNDTSTAGSSARTEAAWARVLSGRPAGTGYAGAASRSMSHHVSTPFVACAIG